MINFAIHFSLSVADERFSSCVCQGRVLGAGFSTPLKSLRSVLKLSRLVTAPRSLDGAAELLGVSGRSTSIYASGCLLCVCVAIGSGRTDSCVDRMHNVITNKNREEKEKKKRVASCSVSLLLLP